jgi:hypothetical protein
MIRNALWKGNPVYPLFNNVFNPQASQQECSLSPDSAYWECETRLGPFLKRKLVYDEAWWETALIPIRVFFQGQDNDGRLFDGRLNPLLLVLPLAAFCIPRRRSGQEESRQEKLFLLLFAVLFLLSVFLQRDMRIRYTGPMLPPLVILSAWGLQRLIDWLGLAGHRGAQPGSLSEPYRSGPSKPERTAALFRWLPLLLIGTLLAGNGLYLGQQLERVQPLGYLSGQTDRQEYILKRRPEYAVYRYANSHLEPDARLLGLFLGNRRYYLHRRTFCNLPYFEQLLRTSGTPKALAASLQEDGITHIVLSLPLFKTWAKEAFPAGRQRLLQAFFRIEARKLYAENGFGLYALSRQPGTKRGAPAHLAHKHSLQRFFIETVMPGKAQPSMKKEPSGRGAERRFHGDTDHRDSQRLSMRYLKDPELE